MHVHHSSGKVVKRNLCKEKYIYTLHFICSLNISTLLNKLRKGRLIHPGNLSMNEYELVLALTICVIAYANFKSNFIQMKMLFVVLNIIC